MADLEPFPTYPDSAFGFSFKQRETPLARTYDKQEKLDHQLIPMPLAEIITPIESEAGYSFNTLFCKKYDVQPPLGKKEPVRTSLEEIADLKDYFVEQSGRRYYRYIDRRFHPNKPEDQLADFLIVEEDTPSGMIIGIFNYPMPKTNPYVKELDLAGKRQRVPFLNLRACYAVRMENGVRDQARAIDLMSFWQEYQKPLKKDEQVWAAANKQPFLRAQRDEMTVQRIGFLPKTITMTPQDQLNMLKEDGYLLFQDSNSPTRWLERLLPVAAFSQSEKDKAVDYNRDAEMLGMIRTALGERPQPKQTLIQTLQRVLLQKTRQSMPTSKEETLRKNALLEAEEWIRNRLAVALYIPLRLHRLGFDIIPTDKYGEFTKAADRLLATFPSAKKTVPEMHNEIHE